MSILIVMFNWSTSNLSSVDCLTVLMLAGWRVYSKGECFNGVVHFLLVTSCCTNPFPSSGAVPLIILGTNLDAAVSPMLTLIAAGVQLINVVSGFCTIILHRRPYTSVYTHYTTQSECRKGVHTCHIVYCTLSLQTCTVVSPTRLLCMIPELTNVTSGASLDYSLTFDGQVLSSLSSVQPLRAVADPVFYGSSPTQYAEYINLLLTISVSKPALRLCWKLSICTYVEIHTLCS